MDDNRFLAPWQLQESLGPVIVIDVIRAFTTAAFAFAAGASVIRLVATVTEALDYVAQHPGSLAMGEVGGGRPAGFAFSNSPAQFLGVDLDGATLVQRTSAGTQGALAARHAAQMWCASLVTATATERAVTASGLGAPVYVITGWFPDSQQGDGDDDLACARHIESIRTRGTADRVETAEAVRSSVEAARTLALGPDDADPRDIELACDIDRFDFAMFATVDEHGVELTPRR